MKGIPLRQPAAFTLPELLIVVAVLCVAAVVVSFGPIKKSRNLANRVKCQGNQKCIGTAFRVFADSNGGRYPLEAMHRGTNSYIVPGGATNSQVNSTNAAAWQVAQAMWSELQTPKVLLCPSDLARRPAIWVTDFVGLAGYSHPWATDMTKTSLGHPDNQDKALSYAFGVAADESRPLGVLIVDRNVNNVGFSGATIATNLAFTRTRVVLNHKAGPTQAVWVTGTRIHDLQGNLCYADGSQNRVNVEGLRGSLANAMTKYGGMALGLSSGTITNQNEMLFP